MKIVAISILSPHHRHVLAGLHAQFPIEHIIRPVWPLQRTTWREKAARLIRSPLATILEKLQSKLAANRARRRDAEMRKLLTDQNEEAISRIAVTDWAFNDFQSPTLIDSIRELRPDVIVTSGGPILKPELFEIPRIATINVHWGIAPEYRGENTLFWPLYFQDYQNLGVTIHVIDQGIDTGPILAHGRVSLTRDDTEISITAKAASVASQLLPAVIQRIDKTQSAKGIVRTGGRLFLRRQRTFYRDFRYWCRQKSSRKAVPELGADEPQFYFAE